MSLSRCFKGKKILVTGGTGSIGSEIVHQVLSHGPAVVRILSRDETKQFFFREQYASKKNVRFLIGDIRNRFRLMRAMEDVDIVFHAAAMKHVPLCEYNPFEAVQTNVIGTQNVIDAALDCGVKKVVSISTDKAITPTNTMGATKLLSEKIIATANLWAKNTRFACVRFGNVLGSRGSLLPIIESCVLEDKPVPLTHCDMTRFMMSIPQAVKLVLQSAVRMKGGECFILKMPALRVRDLIEVAVKYYCRKHKKDPASVVIKETGPRIGEKIDEVLLTREELALTRELADMFCVLPADKGVSGTRKLKEEEYDSAKAKYLSKSEIMKLLKSVL